MSAELDRAIRSVVRHCMGVSAGEEVLVVCNPATEEIGALMRIEAGGDGADATLAVISERDTAAAEPPAPVAAAMAAADVVLAPTIQSLSHTAARKAASEAGVRIGTLPGVTEEMLVRLMNSDLEEIRRRGWAIVSALNSGSEARITCRRGSDFRIGLEGRLGIVDAGELSSRGAFGNLPCGEGFIAPLEETCEGTLVVDGSIAEVGLVETPTKLTIEGGHLTAVEGDAGERLMALLSPHGPAAPTSPSSGSAPTRRRSRPATSSRTRRSSAPPTSPSAPRRRSAAPSRSPSTSTAWSSNRRSKSTARRSSAAASC